MCEEQLQERRRETVIQTYAGEQREQQMQQGQEMQQGQQMQQGQETLQGQQTPQEEQLWQSAPPGQIIAQNIAAELPQNIYEEGTAQQEEVQHLPQEQLASVSKIERNRQKWKARREARRQERKEALKEQAKERTEKKSVVSGVTREDWERDGGASFHYTLPIEEARKVEAQSNGFLYARFYKDGLCELRPTLPDEVTVGDRTIPLRRTYNLLIKALVHGMLDENGDLIQTPSHEEGSGRKYLFWDDVNYYFGSGMNMPEADAMRTQLLRPQLLKILHGNKKEADEVLRNINALRAESHDHYFLPNEILSSFAQTGTWIKFFGGHSGDGQTLAREKERIRREEKAKGRSDEEIEKELSQFVVPDLLMQEDIARRKMLDQNPETPLTQEQEEEIAILRAMYADMDRTVSVLMKIRNMDPDSKDVPLPNACSANAKFIWNIRRNLMKQDVAQTYAVRYETWNHFEQNRSLHLAYVVEHFDELMPEGHMNGKKKDDFEAFARRDKNASGEEAPLSEEEWADVLEASKRAWKYEYHEAGNIGITEDNKRLTLEGFAPETKQFMVEPFTIDGIAVGMYKRNEEGDETVVGSDMGEKRLYANGMIRYYNHDNPLPNDETEAAYARAKIRLTEERKLPGDP